MNGRNTGKRPVGQALRQPNAGNSQARNYITQEQLKIVSL